MLFYLWMERDSTFCVFYQLILMSTTGKGDMPVIAMSDLSR